MTIRGYRDEEDDLAYTRAADQRWQHYLELCRRARQAPAWRWTLGMQSVDRLRVLRVAEGYIIAATQPDRGWPELVELPEEAVPALSERATQGCILQRLQEVELDHRVCLATHGTSVALYYHDGAEPQVVEASSVEEALVLALEQVGRGRGEGDGE